MPKISALPPMTSPDTADPAPVVDDSATTTKKMTLGAIRDWLYSLVNIPAGPASPVTRDSEHFFDHVASGLVITGDAYASTRNASMTAGVCYINGRRISLSSVAARSYTASRDTYVDVLDNQNGTGTLVYTEVTNNNASPALAANSLRIGIVVTGASNIASVASINQGQRDKILPIASSIPYTVADSLGNLICSRDPNRRLLCYRQRLADFAPGTTAETLITGFNCPSIIPTGRKVKVSLYSFSLVATTTPVPRIYRGIFGSGGAQIQQANQQSAGNVNMSIVDDNTSGLVTFTATIGAVSGNPTLGGAAANPSFLMVELD